MAGSAREGRRPRTRRRFTTGLLVGVLFAMFGAFGADASGPRQFIIIGTGDPTGVYFAAGNAVCRAVDLAQMQDRPHGIRCSAPPTRGSLANLDDLVAGQIDLAVIQSDVQYDSFNATDPARVPPMPELRSVLSLHAEPFQIVVGHDSGIRDWADLAGRRIGVGEQGSGSVTTMTALIRAHGADPATFASLVPVPVAEETSALCGGRLDAFAITIGIPNGIVARAIAGCEARLIDLDDKGARWMIESRPYVAAVTIPPGAYRMLDEPVVTFGMFATLVTTATASEQVVYEVTRAVFEHLDVLRRLHPALAHLDPEAMIHDGLTAPLHPGAARYYIERGWLPPAKS